MNAAYFGVLGDKLLDERLIIGFELSFQLLDRAKVGHLQLFDSLAAHSVECLCHKDGIFFKKGGNLPLVGIGEIEPIASYLGAVFPEKQVFFGKFLAMLGWVEIFYVVIIFFAGDELTSFGGGHIVHTKNGVVDVSCAIFERAGRHIEINRQLTFSRIFMDPFDKGGDSRKVQILNSF